MKLMLCATLVFGLAMIAVHGLARADNTGGAIFVANSSLRITCDIAELGQAVQKAHFVIRGLGHDFTLGRGDSRSIQNTTSKWEVIEVDFTYADVDGNWHKSHSVNMLWQDNNIQKFDVQDTGAGISFFCMLARQ